MQLPPARCPVTGEWSPLRSVKINRFEGFKACSHHLLPLTCTQAHPAKAPMPSAALEMDSEMLQGPCEAVTYTRTASPRIWAETLKATPWCKLWAKAGWTKGSEKLGKHRGDFFGSQNYCLHQQQPLGFYLSWAAGVTWEPTGFLTFQRLWKSSLPSAGRELKAGGMARSQCPARAKGLRQNRAAHPNSSLPRSVTNLALVSVWPLPRHSRQRLCWRHIHRHPLLDAVQPFATRSAAHVRLAEQLARPSKELDPRTDSEGNNSERNTRVFFSGIQFLVQCVAYIDVPA